MREHRALKNGSKIAVIGGGPAGSFFAHFAKKWAFRKGLAVSITIFDGKDFLLRGPRGCNLCAGVISDRLSRRLKAEGIVLPEPRIINRIESYCLHLGGETVLLSCAENRTNPIATVFRGNGPRYSTFPGIISFDDYLLSWAQDIGATVISHPIWDIQRPQDPSQPIRLSYGKKANPQAFVADLVVGAMGVNSFLERKFGNLGFGYKAPSTLTIFQAELKLGEADIQKRFGKSIHVFMPKSKLIRYATIIPKGDYVTVTLIGWRDAAKDIFDAFLRLEGIQDMLSNPKPACFCYPKFPVSPAKKPFSDRLVLIGDASFSRQYKNGLESAFLTAQLAAETAFSSGIDAASFEGYYARAKKQIIHDNYYGRLLLLMNDVISSVPLLTQANLSLVNKKSQNKTAKKIRSILWNMLTGNILYREIFKMMLDPQIQVALLGNMLGLLPRKMKVFINQSDRRSYHAGIAETAQK